MSSFYNLDITHNMCFRHISFYVQHKSNVKEEKEYMRVESRVEYIVKNKRDCLVQLNLKTSRVIVI